MKAFNYMVAENACKFVSIQGTKGRFNFNDCDNHLKKAKELGMDFRGHALVWHAMAPQWLEQEGPDQMKESIINHITTVLKHYEGQIDTWDVVNEAIDDGSNGNGWKMRNSFLYQKVPNFIDIAFETARKVSPNTKLFYNDYNTEGIWAKSESVYQFVADMKKRNIPIDGVGIQYHVGVKVQPEFSKINDLISRYCKLGVEVHITELDVSCDDNCRDPDGGDGKQGDVYANALKACLGNSCCTGFLVWGIGDPDSWRGAENKPLLFNSNYQPKGQYNTLLNVLKSTPAASLGGKGASNPAPANNPTTNPSPNTNTNTNPAPSNNNSSKLSDGSYTIKNPVSGKYLNVNNQNVVLGSTAQAWKLTNNNDGSVTLESNQGMLEVNGGSSENNANIKVGQSGQKFILISADSGTYMIGTGVSNGSKVIDIDREGTTDGSNILQWDRIGKSNQVWKFETVAQNAVKEPEKEKPASSSCWAKELGYPCCSTCRKVYFEDDDGQWGVENNEWCGINKDCAAQSNAVEGCAGVDGYSCCKTTCFAYTKDSNGSWGVEDGDWCLIDKRIC